MSVLLHAENITPEALNFMDREHLDEINLINRLYEILQHDLLLAIVYPEAVECLNRLVAETRAHFEHEERLMLEKAYPGFEMHQRKHRAFMKLLDEAASDFIADKDRKKLRQFLEQVLRDWFVNHLRTEDRMLAEFSRRSRT